MLAYHLLVIHVFVLAVGEAAGATETRRDGRKATAPALADGCACMAGGSGLWVARGGQHAVSGGPQRIGHTSLSVPGTA